MKKLKRMLRNRHISKFYSVILEDLEEYEPKFDISFVKDQYGIKDKVYTPRDGLKYVYFMDLQGHMVKSTLDKKQ